MIRWFEQYYAIARNALKLFLSDPFVLILNLFFISATLLMATLPTFSFGGQIKLFREQAFALALVGSSLAVTLGYDRIICSEIKKGTINILMSRPVSHSAYVFGKWTGLMIGMGVIFLTIVTSALWATRIISSELHIEPLGVIVYVITVLVILIAMAVKHFLFKGSFIWQSNIVIAVLFSFVFLIINFWGYNGHSAEAYGALVNWETGYGYLFLFLGIAVFSAILANIAVTSGHAVLVSTAVIIFIVAITTQYVASLIPSLFVQNILLSIFPSWQEYWVADKIASHNHIDIKFTLSLILQAVAQSTLFLVTASALFKRKEISGSI